ncbi:MAG: hypothetical protein AB1898_22315 [Acidobacteriota bacterium]
MLKSAWLIASGLALITVMTLAVSRKTDELDPLKVAPDTHKLLFENRFLRVIEAKVPAGGQEPRHSHPHGLTVYLADYDVEIKTIPDDKLTRARRKFGTVSWSEAVVHEVRNVGESDSHAIRVELK